MINNLLKDSVLDRDTLDDTISWYFYDGKHVQFTRRTSDSPQNVTDKQQAPK